MLFILIASLVVIGLGFFSLLYLVSQHRNGYWQRRGIPSPPNCRPFSGHLDEMFGPVKIRQLQLRNWSQQLGRVYGLMSGWTKTLVISDPAMVHELLVTKFDCFHGRIVSPLLGDVDTVPRMHLVSAHGARWKRLRAMANPAFSASSLKKVLPTVNDSIKATVGFLEAARQQNPDQSINVHRFFSEMTYDVISRVAMGQRESRQFRSPDAAVTINVLQRFNNNWFDYIANLFPWVGTNVLRPLMMNTGRLRRDPLGTMFDRTMAALEVRMRERALAKQNAEPVADTQTQEDQAGKQQKMVDFIDLFLDALADKIADEKQTDVFNRSVAKIERKITLEEVMMQLVVFLFAGFDTSANSFGFVCYHLSKFPEVQRKVQEEISSNCTNEKLIFKDPTFEQLSKLKYTEAVIMETLRLYPIGGIVVNRMCAQTTTLGKYTVERETAVSVDVWSLHRYEDVWGPDAGEFKPERWLKQDAQFPAFYAFGGGPRACIGMRFAMMEEKAALVLLLRSYSFVHTEETEKGLKFCGQVALNPGAVYVKLEPRKLK